MTVSTLKPAPIHDFEALHEDRQLTAEHDEEIRAIQALGILLESRLIDQMEYERRVVVYKRPDLTH